MVDLPFEDFAAELRFRQKFRQHFCRRRRILCSTIRLKKDIT
jgi:hypothetical protein